MLLEVLDLALMLLGFLKHGERAKITSFSVDSLFFRE
jgi:hypothetical protein